MITKKYFMKVIWNNQVIAKSDITFVVENNHYFPADSINKEFFKSSGKHTTCPWKGAASYYDIDVNGKTNEGAAWFYAEPKEAAKEIKNHVAFWKGISIEK